MPMFRRNIEAPGTYGVYSSPDMSVVPATVLGLDGYQWNSSNHAWFKSMEKEGMRLQAKPPLVIPQGYLIRGLRTEANPPAGLGTLRTMLSGKV